MRSKDHIPESEIIVSCTGHHVLTALPNFHAPSNCRTSSATCYHRKELEKKRTYEKRINKVEHGSFMPIVLSSSGGRGPSATMALKILACLLLCQARPALQQDIDIHPMQNCFLSSRLSDYVPKGSQVILLQASS